MQLHGFLSVKMSKKRQKEWQLDGLISQVQVVSTNSFSWATYFCISYYVVYKRPETAATCPNKQFRHKIHLFFLPICQEEISEFISPEVAVCMLSTEVFLKKVFLKISQIHSKTPVLESLFNKVDDFRPATLFKWNSSTSVFLWTFRNFSAHLFERILRTTASFSGGAQSSKQLLFFRTHRSGGTICW